MMSCQFIAVILHKSKDDASRDHYPQEARNHKVGKPTATSNANTIPAILSFATERIVVYWRSLEVRLVVIDDSGQAVLLDDVNQVVIEDDVVVGWRWQFI